MPNIFNFIKSLMPSLSKSDIESDLEATLSSIDLVLSVYSQMAEVQEVTKFKAKLNKDLVTEFYKELSKSGMKKMPSSNKLFAKDMVTLFTDVKVNAAVIQKGVQEATNEVVVTHALTALRANSIRAVGHLYFLSRYALDLANLFYIEEAQEAGMDYSAGSTLNKKQRQMLTENMWIFARLIGVYGEKGDSLQERMGALTPAVLPKDASDEVLSVYGIDKVDILSTIPDNFIGSPIYSVRLVFAQWEADRYAQLKDKKRLLELRVLHLRLLSEDGQSSPAMEKELGDLQQRVTDIDYKIAKLEADVEM